MKTRLLAFALFAATAGVVIAHPARQNGAAIRPPVSQPQPLPAAAAKDRPKVEVVFALDTTGSMSGLIQAAKDNIWSIASSMAKAQPAPEIEIGLVAYRDRGDSYVTHVVDLSSDLDSMYATLMDFRAEGGGDTPESVNQALHDAVHRVSWSQDTSSYKVIFLVGDAPPHMNYRDDVKFPETLEAARAKGIVVNTIQAGAAADTTQVWREIASLNQGEYFQVGQSGNAVAVATPYDEQIAALSKDLDGTRLFYGDAEKLEVMELKQAAADKLHALGSAASRAKRAMFNASEAGVRNLFGDSDLVDDVTSGRADLGKIERSNLPAAIRDLEPERQAEVIEETAAKRAELSRQIDEFAKKRQAYIESELKESIAERDSLDYRIFSTVREQAAQKGLEYDDKPAF